MLLLTLLGLSCSVMAKSFVVGVERLQYHPYYYVKDHEFQGFARDLIDMFSHSSGHDFKYRILPVKRLYDEFFHEKIDFKFPDNRYWQADKRIGINISYSAGVVGFEDGLMVLATRETGNVKGIKTIGKISGFTPWPYLNAIEKRDIILSEHYSIKGIIKQVIHKRIDGAYLNVKVAQYQLENVMGMTGILKFDSSLPHVKGDYSLSTSKHPNIIVQFNDFLKEYESEIIILKEKYELN